MSTTFGDELKRLRMRRGLSQKRLSLAAGLDHSIVSRLESGARTQPRRETVEALASALACNQTERFALLTAAGFHAGIELDPSLREINDYLTDPRCSVADRERVRAVIGALTAVAVERSRLAIVRRSAA